MTNDFEYFANQMMQGVLGMQKMIDENVNKMKNQMTKEQAIEFDKAMSDSKVHEIVKNQMEQIKDFNKTKDAEY